MSRLFILSSLLVAFLFWGCDEESPSHTTANNPTDPCGEIGGEDHYYAVREVYIPVGTSEEIGADLDGDDFVDNKLANLYQSLISSSPDFAIISDSLNELLASGKEAILFRLRTEAFTGLGDADVSGTFYRSMYTGDATETMFDGTGTFAIQADEPNHPTLCGRLYGGGITELGPGRVTLTLPISDSQELVLELVHAQIVARSTPEEVTNMVLSGAMDPRKIREELLPAFVDDLNDAVISTPEESTFLLDTFDGTCDTTLPQCGAVTTCTTDGYISLEELQCNSTLNIILSPDVTIEGKEYVSFGVRLTAAKALLSPGS